MPSSSPAVLWARIIVVVIGAALSSSVLQAFPTVQPVLLDRRPAHGAALFASHCSNSTTSNNSSDNNNSTGIDACEAQLDAAAELYSISLGVSTGTSLITGWIYDRVGPRRSAVFGALSTAVGFGVLTAGLCLPRLEPLVYVGVTLADCAGALTSLAVYGFSFHSPRHAALVTAMYATSIGLSAELAQLAVWIVRISSRAAEDGSENWSSRSNRPGRRSAGSSESIRFVAPMRMT